MPARNRQVKLGPTIDGNRIAGAPTADTGAVKIIGIALDEQGETIVRPFAETFEIDYPVLLGNQDIFTLFDGFVVPHTVVLDRSLTVRKMYRGPVTRATLEEDIRTFDATG